MSQEVTDKVRELLEKIEVTPNKWHDLQIIFKKDPAGKIYVEDRFRLMRIEPFKTEATLMNLCPLHYQKWCER